MLVRGRSVILTIAVLTIGAAAFAWWYNVQQSRRSVEFWGRATAELLRDASDADLLRVSNEKPSNAELIEKMTFNDEDLFVIEHKEIRGKRGVLSVLIEDAAFDWTKTPPPRGRHDAQQMLGIEIRRNGIKLMLIVDLAAGGVFELNKGAAATLSEECIKRFRDLKQQQFPSQNWRKNDGAMRRGSTQLNETQDMMYHAAGATAVAEEAPPETEERKATTTRGREKTKRQPPYAVVLHNDDLNTFDFVIGVLRKVFGYDKAQATQLTTTAHRTGRSIVWTGQLEIAELKADQIRSCGPDPEMKASGALALRVTIEPLPQ